MEEEGIGILFQTSSTNPREGTITTLMQTRFGPEYLGSRTSGWSSDEMANTQERAKRKKRGQSDLPNVQCEMLQFSPSYVASGANITNEKLPRLEREKGGQPYRKFRARGRSVGYAFESYIHASVACCRAGSRQEGFARINVYAVYDRYRRLRARVLCGSSRAWNEGSWGGECLEASAGKRLCLADTLGTGIYLAEMYGWEVIYECVPTARIEKKIWVEETKVEESGVWGGRLSMDKILVAYNGVREQESAVSLSVCVVGE